jgi:hypothetical protein
VLDKTIVRLAIPVAIGALALTACGSDNGDGSDGAGGNGTVYKIAFQGPLSGANVALGENLQNGIELAITKHAKNAGWKAKDVILAGVSQITKEEKRGLARGFLIRLGMYSDVFFTWLKTLAGKRY